MDKQRPENSPQVEVGLVVGRRQQDGSAVCRVWYAGRDGERVWMTPRKWASGRPTPSQVTDVAVELCERATLLLTDRLGVQGVLPVA